MPFWLRAVISIVVGGVAAVVILLVAGPEVQKSPILLWNVNFFIKLAGNGPLLGYDPAGNPRYEGSPVLIFWGLLGLASTFPIYMIISFILLTIGNKLLRKAPADESEQSFDETRGNKG